MVKPVVHLNIDENKYEKSQKRFWERLHQELDRYKTELGATNTELAQCLGISRQPLVSFMQDSSNGLPIRRANLERLWDLLTDPEYFKGRQLSSQARLNREELRRKGSDGLLKVAGFLPNLNEPILTSNPNRYQQIQRVVSKLSTLPVTDFADFIRVVESVETFITKAFSSGKTGTNIDLIGGSCADFRRSADDWFKRWSQTNDVQSDVEIGRRFKGAINKLAISGRYQLEDSEYFELYIAILENERQSCNVSEFLKIRVSRCEFKVLTFFLGDYVTSNCENLKLELRAAGINAETHLRSALLDQQHAEGKNYLEDAISDFVMEASVTCNFRKTNEDIRWRYSSSTTHFENMLAALSHGMGYESELELVDFSIRTLGRRDYSLVKTSTTFGKIDHSSNPHIHHTYQGLWIDRSAILAILQSAVTAVTGWLNEKLIDSESCENYYRVCKTIATIDDSLIKGRKILNGYGIQCAEYAGGFSSSHYLEKKVIDAIKELREWLLETNPILWKCYEADLEKKYFMAMLSCAHSALIEGNMKVASRFLNDTEEGLGMLRNESVLIRTLFNAEKQLQKLFLGDREFLSDKKNWRSKVNESLKELSQDIYNSRYGKYCGRFDSDIYMVASEVFGRVGRLDFCLSDPENSNDLEEAIRNFLKAAYCSAKIGHKQRAAHWVSNASRACCRLGQVNRAKEFFDLANSIIDRAIEPTYSSEYREAVLTEVNISLGEILMLEKDFSGALEYFLRSLKGAIYIGFARLIADSLYDISRASKYLGNYRVTKSFEGAFGKDYLRSNQNTWNLREDKQGWKENRTAAEVIQFFNQIDINADWSSASDQFRQEAKKIWRRFANSGNSNGAIEHPIESAIDSYQYLGRVG